MDTPWTDAFAEAEACVVVDTLRHVTLELQHPAFVQGGVQIPLRFVLDVEPRHLGIESGAVFGAGAIVEFTPFAFHADFPTFGEAKIPECKVRIDNVARDLMPYLDEAVKYRADLKVIYREYHDDDVSAPIYGPVEFLLTKCTAKDTFVEGTATFADLANMRFPRRVFSRKEYTSLSF